MKILSFLLSILFFQSCDLLESEKIRTKPQSVKRIEKIEVKDYEVKATVVVETPTPCWEYFKTEKNYNGSEYIGKIICLELEGVCIQVIDSFYHVERIQFNSKGEKTLKFWQDDSTYLDTTIVIQ